MLKFNRFVNEELNGEQANLGNVARQEAQPARVPATDQLAPVIKSNLNDRIVKLTTKYKSGITTTGTTISNTGATTTTTTPTKEPDPLTLKIKNFGLNQDIDIKLNNNVHIKAKVEKSGNKKYCKLIKTNWKDIKLYTKDLKNVYFQTFKDKNNKTKFYFYNNIDFVNNPKAPPLFYKSFMITSID
jgi:hypothetical protein